MIDETVEEIAEMQTHSSSVVAVKAALALRGLTEREYPSVEEYVRDIDRNSRALRRANPSHASLHTTQREIVQRTENAPADDLKAVQQATVEAIDDVVDQVESANHRAGERAALLIEDGETLLTHDYSSTVLDRPVDGSEDGAECTIYVTEARPRCIGRKLARELADRDALDVTLIVDSAAGYYLEECDRVLVGMDCIVEDTLYNRVGTYPIAATAADRDVPVMVVGAQSKCIDGGFAFENEFRAAAEVMREPAEGFDVANPAYDATPTRLLERVVTDEGIVEY